MAEPKKTTVKVRPFVLEPLKELQDAVARDFGVPSKQDEMVGALITGTTVAQAVGMLQAYVRDTKVRDAEAATDDEDDGSG